MVEPHNPDHDIVDPLASNALDFEQVMAPRYGEQTATIVRVHANPREPVHNRHDLGEFKKRAMAEFPDGEW